MILLPYNTILYFLINIEITLPLSHVMDANFQEIDKPINAYWLYHERTSLLFQQQPYPITIIDVLISTSMNIVYMHIICFVIIANALLRDIFHEYHLTIEIITLLRVILIFLTTEIILFEFKSNLKICLLLFFIPMVHS